MLLMHETKNAEDLINWIHTSKKHFFIAVKLFIVIKLNARMGPTKNTADSDACQRFSDLFLFGLFRYKLQIRTKIIKEKARFKVITTLLINLKYNSNVWNFPLDCGIKGGRFSQLLAIYLSCQDLRGKKKTWKRARLPASCVTISQLLVKVRKWKKKTGSNPCHPNSL